jgi:hypothetical protein
VVEALLTGLHVVAGGRLDEEEDSEKDNHEKGSETERKVRLHACPECDPRHPDHPGERRHDGSINGTRQQSKQKTPDPKAQRSLFCYLAVGLFS